MPKVKNIEANRFSVTVTWDDWQNVEILQSWKRWFDERGIRADILPANKQGTLVALYREGLLEVADDQA